MLVVRGCWRWVDIDCGGAWGSISSGIGIYFLYNGYIYDIGLIYLLINIQYDEYYFCVFLKHMFL